jgi:RNA polymerase sigma-70 factor, ECF subfamily
VPPIAHVLIRTLLVELLDESLGRKLPGGGRKNRRAPVANRDDGRPPPSKSRPTIRSEIQTPGALRDDDSRAWIEALSSEGPPRDQAIARLHELLLRAARFEVGRRERSVPHLRGGDLEDIATQSADDALVAVLAKLDDFQGRSSFKTWAYKFALLEASVKIRRLAWQGREIPVEPAEWPRFRDDRSSPQAQAERTELLDSVSQAIDGDLTPHQREVLVALALNEVPIDVLAERLDTTRGALYKTLHDARRKLRRSVESRGHSVVDE